MVNKVEACDVEPQLTRVNQRGDLWEFANHFQSSAVLEDGRLLVAYSAQSADRSTLVLRYALMTQSGVRMSLCSDASPERTLVETGASAVVARSNLRPTVSSEPSVAAMAWHEPRAAGQFVGRFRLFNSAGCPLGPQPTPVGGDPDGVVIGMSMAWNEQAQQVWLVYGDGRDVFLAKYSSSVATERFKIASESVLFGQFALSVDAEGRAFLAWAASNLQTIASGTNEVVVRYAFLDAQGVARAQGDVPLGDLFLSAGKVPSVATAHRAGRFALAVEAQESAAARARIKVIEFDADTAVPVAEAFNATESGASQASPGIAYLPNDTLAVGWVEGAYARVRLFKSGTARARFNAVTCDEQPFFLGKPYSGPIASPPNLHFAHDQLWVVHAGAPDYDPEPPGVLAWHLPFADLWPGGH